MFIQCVSRLRYRAQSTRNSRARIEYSFTNKQPNKKTKNDDAINRIPFAHSSLVKTFKRTIEH